MLAPLVTLILSSSLSVIQRSKSTGKIQNITELPSSELVFFGHPSIVEFLLKHPKVEVNKIQKEGATPFLSACCNGHNAVVSLLWLT